MLNGTSVDGVLDGAGVGCSAIMALSSPAYGRIVRPVGQGGNRGAGGVGRPPLVQCRTLCAEVVIGAFAVGMAAMRAGRAWVAIALAVLVAAGTGDAAGSAGGAREQGAAGLAAAPDAQV